MSLTLVLATFLVLFLLSLAAWSFFLWLGAKLVKIADVSYRRALLTCVVILLVCLPLQLSLRALSEWWLFDVIERGPLLPQLFLLVSLMGLLFGLCFALPCLCVKWFLRTSLGRAALATLIMLAGGCAANLLLALSVRHTLLEAFVIPTGSMAPTIFGAHAGMTCENCELTYAVSMSDRAHQPEPYWQPVATTCPNCAQPGQVPTDARMLSGDRILADKIGRPNRWDLIVFRHPEDPSVNYIDRLVGLPGETLEIVGGDIFIDGQRLRKEPGTAADMWLFVHDTRYAARQSLPGGPGWEPDQLSSHWKHVAGKWTFTGRNADDDSLLFSGRITDELAYNGNGSGLPRLEQASLPLAGDLKVECWVGQFSGEGSFAFQWRFRDQPVTATVTTSGAVEIASVLLSANGPEDNGQRKVASGKLSGDVSERQHLAFAFRDGQAYVTQNGQVVASLLVGPEDIETFKDRLRQPAEPCRLEMVASRCSLTLSRIALLRDVYYRNLDQLAGLPVMGPQWGCADHPITLKQDEHFVLGDNSARSKDSRFWGTVPSEQIIGVARWIYWPSSRWHEFH